MKISAHIIYESQLHDDVILRKNAIYMNSSKLISILAAGAIGISANASDRQTVSQSDSIAQTVPGLKLNNGATMPQFGLGVFQIKDGDNAYNAVLTALQNGYRHIDTAHAYQNERSVGRAVKDSGIPREEIWITSKLWPNEYGEEATPAAIDRMLKRLGVDYIDLLYLHQPVGDYVGGYKAMEQALKDGKLRAIGISNFDFSDSLYHSLVDSVTLMPDAMQIECHPFAQRKHWKEVLDSAGIVLEAWFPLGGRDSNGEILRNPVICEIAKAHDKSPAQVVIRWHVQKGHSVIPGAENPAYIKENIEVFDWELTPEEMARIEALDLEKRYFNMSYDQIKQWFSGYELID